MATGPGHGRIVCSLSCASLMDVKALLMAMGPGPAGEHAAQPDGHCFGHEVPALSGHRAQVTFPIRPHPYMASTTPDAAQLHASDVCV